MLYPKKQIGFSLIELMVVIAIISILVSLAIPSYQDYMLRARFTEILTAVEPYKIAVALALQEGIPAKILKNGVYGIPKHSIATKHIASIKVKNGVITALATKLLKDVTYILKPINEGTDWVVSGSCLHYNLCSEN